MSDEGLNDLKKIYDKLLYLAQFPGSNSQSPATLLKWYEDLSTFYSLMKNFANTQLLDENQNTMEKFEALLKSYRGPSDFQYFILKGYDILFEFLEGLAGIFHANGLMNSEQGKAIIHDMINKCFDFVQNNRIDNNSSIFLWECHLDGLNALLIGFGEKAYSTDYRLIKDQLVKIANEPGYSEDREFLYVKALRQYFEIMIQWLNQWDPNILIPLNLSKSR
ncbi:hypothetical protein [Ferroplasma acidarmanus]|uniref:Uncharacterized protein n=1 Tax=Ferroplasma acidarmanus Fer1 TaxID=333146 RepID=S0ARK3_FERAC|nr:hypothetical protein [Ferroplasma acidarmanus]AGO61412.1 hypothetical protein FACI_IFERC00001G1432 [Ferroplasma acidarmanus Fer1]